MEQKHIDEMDESFLGEEFIDEEVTPQVTAVKSHLKPKKAKPKAKTVAKKTSKSVAAPAMVSPATVSVQSIHSPEPQEEVLIAPAQVKAASAKTERKTEPPVEMARPPVNPWEGEEKGESVLNTTSTWKALTGLAVILLLLSIFTQGFQFSAGITPQEAESKALNYVNTNLLRPPFTAEVKSLEKLNDLYKITLSVAGEEVDSYLTADGQIFFPQGFMVGDSIPEIEPVSDVVAEEALVQPAAETTAKEPAVEVTAEETAAEAAVPVSGEIVPLTLHYKKWVFSPGKMTVALGSQVKLALVPDNSNPTQGLAEFTFAIPGLGIEKEVTGQTEVVFTADKAGSFEYTCSSCEDFRGMKGTLTVK